MNVDFPAPLSCLPRAAQERITRSYESGAKQQADYYIGDELVWRRSWNREGQRDYEQGYRSGVPHGVCRYWFDNGVLSHETFYLCGREHGISRQYDDAGNLIGTYTMICGTGLDRWFQKFDDEPATLSEERQYEDGYLHGFERWYWSAEGEYTIFSEKHYQKDTEHGIFRRWNDSGRLSRGFPQYYVNGERVNKRRYLTACKHDPTLPPYHPEDNDWHRIPLAP